MARNSNGANRTYSLNRQPRTLQSQEQRQEVSYDTKGVTHCLEEDDEDLKRDGSEARKETRETGEQSLDRCIITRRKCRWRKSSPSTEYKVNPYIPCPMRCKRCQRYGHLDSNCENQLKCCRCGQAHSWDECNNIENPKFVNCSGHIVLLEIAPKIPRDEGSTEHTGRTRT